MPTLGTHHKVAVLATALMASIALFDAYTAATTGHYSVFAEESDNVLAEAASDVVHGICYAALAWVLVREADRFAGYGRVVRAARKVLVASLAVLCVGFVAVAPVIALLEVSLDGPLGTAWGLVATAAFFGMIGATLVLAVVVWRRNLLGAGGQVLRLLPLVAAGTVVLAVLGSGWAHPAYVEVVINLGIALVGAGSAVGATVRRQPVSTGA